VKLSQLSHTESGREALKKTQYKIMKTRCMHELKTSKVNSVAEKMLMTENDNSIQGAELGTNVLTLHEVLQTFSSESSMYNIQLDKGDYRTVVLTKNEVELDGTFKMIVMIRDVSDRVQLE